MALAAFDSSASLQDSCHHPAVPVDSVAAYLGYSRSPPQQPLPSFADAVALELLPAEEDSFSAPQLLLHPCLSADELLPLPAAEEEASGEA